MSKSRSQYEQIYDGQWFDLPSKWDFACCDCSLVHRIYARLKDGKIQVRFDRNGPATGGRRATLPHKKQ